MATTMPTRRTQRGLGSSDTNTLAQIFPARDNHPVFGLANYNVEDAMRMLVNGVITQNPDVPNFSLDYSGAPTITEWHANPTSPGPGSSNPLDKPPLPAGVVYPSSGQGSQEQPSRTSAAISGQDPVNKPGLGESLGSTPGHPGQ